MNAQFVNPFNQQTGMSPMGNIDNAYFGPNNQATWQPNGNSFNQLNAAQAGQRDNWKVYSPKPPAPPLIGRWVNSFDDIKPQDVPMDGSMCFFPQSDYSCVYAMVWDNNGRITPYRFVPEKNDPPAVQQSANPTDVEAIFGGFANSVNARLDTFEQRMNEMLSSFAIQNQSKTKSQKRYGRNESSVNPDDKEEELA